MATPTESGTTGPSSLNEPTQAPSSDSTPVAPPPAASAPAIETPISKGAPVSTNPELDIVKLQALPDDQKPLFLLNFVSQLSKHVLALQKDDCTAQQFYLKKEVLQIVNLSSPTPTRVVRKSLGKILGHIFEHGDRKLLIETINDLVATTGGGKSKGDVAAGVAAKHAAVYCMGDVYKAAGDSAIVLHQVVCTALLKLLKVSSSNAGLRAAAFTALSKITGMVGSSLDESVARDIWKQGRSYASSDKGYLVVGAVCRCLKALVKNTAYFNNSSDLGKLQDAMFKAFDYPSSYVRRAAADCLAEALVRGFAENATADGAVNATVKKVKGKTLKRQSTMPADEDDIPARSESPAPTKKIALSLSLSEMLHVLANFYQRLVTTNRARVAVGLCYIRLIERLREKTVEANYLAIVEHLSVDLPLTPNIANNRYRLLLTRRIIDTVLQNVIGKKLLGESGQIRVAKLLINDILKNYPQALKEAPEPSKNTLIAALGALNSLLSSLGSAASAFVDAARDGLLSVLHHPSYTVQVHTAACLKTFVSSCPQQLLSCLTICMNTLKRELSQLTAGKGSPRRCVGVAHGLAAIMSVSPLRPLYGSVDINSRVLTMATDLLKSSSKSELRTASTHIQVSWILIGSLMSLGPNFVKIHLSQFLLLWKNALPKPLAKDNTAARTYLEASFLAHVRECALGSILAFLESNSRLLTADVSKRIATMLHSTEAFLKTLPKRKTSENIVERLAPSLQLEDIEMMVQRRVMQCYNKLALVSPAETIESSLQANMLMLSTSLIADPENFVPTSLSATIANAAGNFESIWDVGDQSGYGLTTRISGFHVDKLRGEQGTGDSTMRLEDEGPDGQVESVLRSPICGSLEHDASILYIRSLTNHGSSSNGPKPAATEVVNMAIQLFAFAFPITPAKVQESMLEHIASFVSDTSAQRDTALPRKAAITVNVALALLSTLKVANKETKSPAGNVVNQSVEKLLQDLIRGFVLDPDQYVRNLGYGALARLCSVSGSGFTNQEIKFLIDTIVANREPSARAGCAMALGCILSKMGGMAAGYHMKTILGILMSLCNDPHPTVHYWALEALGQAAEAAGLGFSQYVSSTLGMLAQLYVSDTHDAEVPSAISMNLEVELSSTAAITRCVDSLINVLGPDLQDMTKSRELTLTVVGFFLGEDDVQVLSASLDCMEHLSLYAPGHIIFADYVRLLQKYMNDERPVLRDLAVDGLYNVMKRNPAEVLSVADEGFEEQLWLVLDEEPDHDGLRNIIASWVRQTALIETVDWVQRFQAVLKMTRSRASSNQNATSGRQAITIDLQDEEVAGFAAAGTAAKDEKEGGAVVDAEPLRWQVTAFAMSGLSSVVTMTAKDALARGGESEAQVSLQGKVADIIRLAFSASTAGVPEQRIWGLKVIGAILKMFGKTIDPDFEEAMLLEQYQAQISSALTPAFAADSSPELAAEAVNVCAAFIATGIVTDVDRMGRILKTLVNALQSFSQETEQARIGDLKGLSSNAQVLIKMAVFSAWAELQVASSDQTYLQEVLSPHLALLTPLWLESLREFARLRFEPDISMTLGPASMSGSLDSVYAALNREMLLKFYQDSWLKLVDAIASLIEQDSDLVFDALDGKGPNEPSTNGHTKNSDINYRDEPVAFFFVLFGIAFEALAAKPGQADSLATPEQTLEILNALKKILHPSVSGYAIYKEAIFTETMDLLDRLVLTEGLNVQAVIVDIAQALCVAHPAAKKKSDATDGGELSEDIEQLFELTRIIVLVLAGLLPNLAEGEQPVRSTLTEEGVLLVRSSLNALVDAADVFPAMIRTDLHACILHIFSTILATPSCQQVIVPQSLPTLKRFIGIMTASQPQTNGHGSKQSPGEAQLQGCLRRFLSIYLHAQKREQPTSLATVKNCLLALTVLFSGGRNQLAADDPLVARFLEEVVDCLSDRMTTKIAANCVRSLLLQTSHTAANESIARHLLPKLLAYVANTRPDDPENGRSLVAQTLSTYVTVVSKDHTAIAMALVIPTLLSRAAHQAQQAEDDDNDDVEQQVYRETSARLLELASADQAAFRGVVASMSEAQKGFMEEVIRAGRQAGGGGEAGKGDGDVGGQPSIQLKMNFGG